MSKALGEMVMLALLVVFCMFLLNTYQAAVTEERALFVPRIPGETYGCRVRDDPNSYCHGLAEEVVKLNADLRGAGKPELTIHDIGAMTARDVSRLRMAIRYKVDPTELDGQMRTVRVGKLTKIVEE